MYLAAKQSLMPAFSIVALFSAQNGHVATPIHADCPVYSADKRPKAALQYNRLPSVPERYTLFYPHYDQILPEAKTTKNNNRKISLSA